MVANLPLESREETIVPIGTHARLRPGPYTDQDGQRRRSRPENHYQRETDRSLTRTLYRSSQRDLQPSPHQGDIASKKDAALTETETEEVQKLFGNLH